MGKVATFFSVQGITLSIQQKQQMLMLDKEFESLESKVTRLEAENLKLRAEVTPLKQEVERLKNQSAPQDRGSLDETEVKILTHLSQAGGRRPTAEEIAHHLGINPTRIEYFVNRLTEARFLNASYSSIDPTTYTLDQKGNEYLVKHNIV